ncbi:MAG: endolytic transglycosylase MltG, partial [Solirubrobacterales bacterium]|nr:endolytic transglycosylase MltG [Solirubrobacterales bacterium]
MSGRTPEEREAARQDRERRRGEREDPAAAPGVVAEPAADVEAEPRFEDRRSAEPPGAEHEPEPPVDDDDLALDPEAPAGTRRVSGLERGRSSRGEPRRARRQRAVRRRPARGRARSERPLAAVERRRLHIGRIISVVAILLAGALIWFLVELFQPFHGSGHGSVTVTIPADAGSRAIGDQLARDGVISSGFFFELRATLAGQRGQLRSGTYHLRQDMDYASALKVLTTPPPAAKVTNLTVTEGRTRSQIDALLHAQGIQGSYLTATRHSPLLSPERYGAPGGTPSLEGFLFPSTYQLREPIKIDALIHDQLNTFRQRFAKVNLGFAHGRHLTPYDVLIVASMV